MVCRPTDFLTGARIRSQKMWENSWTQKKSKIDSPIFQDKCKKNYPWSGHRRVSVKRQFFSPVSIKLRYWDDEYMNQSYIKIAGWRNKSTEDHDSYKYAIYAVGKRKPGALPLLRYTDLFFHLIFDCFVAISLYFLANKRGSSTLARSSNFNHYTSSLF